MSLALLAVVIFGVMTWLGGVLIDQAWNHWMDDSLKARHVLSILMVAGLAWGVILPFGILPTILGQ